MNVQLLVKRWGRKLALSRRQKLVAITLLLTVGLVLTQLVPPDWRYPMVIALSLATYVFAALGLREDLAGIEWITLLTLPTFFTAAIALFYFLLPVRWLTRVPVAVLYAVGMYALLLTENIYNVAADRTIALLRAAQSIGFLVTILTYFLLMQTVLAFRFSSGVVVVLTAFISFPLFLQSLWSMELGNRVSRRVLDISVALTLILVELSWVFSYLPVKTTLQALFFTTCFYSVSGMAQQYVVEKLYKRNVIEFFIVCMVVFLLVLVTTSWRGNL